MIRNLAILLAVKLHVVMNNKENIQMLKYVSSNKKNYFANFDFFNNH
jgi:hypothetical protein